MRHLTLTILAASSLIAQAQDLKTEVVVDRTVRAAEREAVRPAGLFPAIVLPVPKPVRLTAAAYDGLSDITRTYDIITPSGNGKYPGPTPYSGYVSAAYGPAMQSDVQAGMRFINSTALTFGADGTFASERYTAGKQQLFDGMVNVYGGWRPDSISALNASLTGRFLSQKSNGFDPQGVQDVILRLGWASQAGQVRYTITANGAFDHGNDRGMGDVVGGAYHFNYTQHDYGFGATASAPVSDLCSFAVALDGRFLNTAGFGTLGVLGVTPTVGLNSGNYSIRIGLRVDDGTGGSVRRGVHLAPQFRLQWQPTRMLGVWANLTGGESLTSFAELRTISPYQSFAEPMAREFAPIVLEGGLRAGLWNGFQADIHGGYCAIDGWANMGRAGFIPKWVEHNIRGWMAGVTLSYDSRLISAHAGADFSGSDYARNWYTNRDHSDLKMNASVTTRPLSPLSVSLGFDFAAHRSAIGVSQDYSTADLGNIADLHLQARWQFTPALTVFGRLDNILNRHWQILNDIEAQGTHGLVGVQYKFR